LRFRYQVVLLLLASASAYAGTFAVAGNSLTVTTANLQVTFNGPDLVAATNTMTGESYLRDPSPAMQLNLTLTQPSSAPLAATGPWTLNADATAAALTLTDSNRTVTVNVVVDAATQQVVVDLNGQARQGGVEKLTFGATGFDMTAGQFALPAQGGMLLRGSSFSATNTYNFPGNSWEAPFLVFQSAKGGLTILSTDTKSLSKDLTIFANLQQTANALLQVEAPGPWKTATEAGPIEWRLAAYTGDWQAGARVYRDWHNAALPPAPLSGGRAWASTTRTVIEYADAKPYQNSTLDSLAAHVNPAQTLLYLVNWRTNGYDVGYPDYSWDPSVPAFIAHAHQLGFRVMLHTDALAVAPSSADFASVQQYQIKDPMNLTPQGWNWNLPASTPNRYALINPAASAYRQLFLARVSPAIQTLQPDAIHLDFSVIFNDGNGLVNGLNFNQGLAQLEKDLLAAFPNLVLGLEESNDMIAPWASFSQPLYWSSSGFSPAATPPAPVSSYALANVSRYWHLGTTNPDSTGFIPNLSQYEAQAVLPTLRTEVSSYSQPDLARFLGVITAFQKYSLTPAWDTPWNGAAMRYQGSGGVAGTLNDSGTLVQFTEQTASSQTTLYTRAHGVNQIDSPLSVPNWPAFNGTVTLGLDPAVQYWLDSSAKPASLPHITALPSGARLGLGTGTLVTQPFAYFQVLGPAAQLSFDFFANLWLANAGVTFQGSDFPLANGAQVSVTNLTVGGMSRQAILSPPPYQGQIGGETFFEYLVPVSAAAGTQLSFAAGIADYEVGQRQGPLTFKVEINGTIAWEQDISTGGWQTGAVDLSPWLGLTVKIRFVTNPGPSGSPAFANGAWSALQMASTSGNTLSGITINAPQGVPNVAVTGGSVSVNGSNVTVNGLPPSGTVLLFTGQASPVASGQTLLNVPFTLAQGSNSQLATVGPPAYAGTGTLGPVASGGVTKQALNAFGPPSGQTILSFLTQLPANPLGLAFSAGFWDNVNPPAAQGFQLSVRVNGQILWQRNINTPPAWQPGAVDLSPWNGKPVLIELITDTLGPNYDDFTSWAELSFGAAGSAPCAASVPAAARTISASASGGSQPIAVTAGTGCDWAAYSPASWIAITPGTASGSGTAMVSIATNPGPQRQSWIAVGGILATVMQAGAAQTAGPEISLVSTIAGGVQATAPNTWLSIFGVNLSATQRTWQSSDFVNGQMPTGLDGVSVSVNGKPAFVEYVSPTQINVLTPLDTTLGTVQVTVTSGGRASPPVWLPMRAAVPGFFQFSGSPYVAATHAAGNLLGPASLYPGATTPAVPGETVTIYGSGFGQTTPPLVSGSPSQSGALSGVGIQVGAAASVAFAGVVSPGLYQFNVVIPAGAAPGDNPVRATYAGVVTPAGALISVGAQ
jgi:uncharacterized protein (TIGR03437 family)